MAMPELGWSASGITRAAKILIPLLKNLNSKKGVKRRQKECLGYLQDTLLPKLRLMTGFVQQIERDAAHPHRGEWTISLRMLRQGWTNFEEYLNSRDLLLDGTALGSVVAEASWTWDELSAKIGGIKGQVKDVLDNIDRLILLEICERFGLVLPRLDTIFDLIQDYGESVSTYRKEVQQVLGSILSNKQDFNDLKGVASIDELAHRLSDSHGETAAVTAQLQTTSEKLERLLGQLAVQRANCSDKAERKYLGRLSRQVRRQADSVVQLRASVEDTMGRMAEVSHAVNGVAALVTRQGVVQKASDAVTDANDLLKRAIVPSLDRLYDNLKRQTWGGELKTKLRLRKRTVPVRDTPSPCSITTTATTTTSSDDQSSHRESSLSQASSSTGTSVLSQTVTVECFELPVTETVRTLGPETASPPSSSPSTSSGDHSATTTISTAAPTTSVVRKSSAPPIPRRSSARLRLAMSRSPTRCAPPVPALPPPPPPVSGSASPSVMQSSASSSPMDTLPSSPISYAPVTPLLQRNGSDSAESLVSLLEKRYSASSPISPPQTPSISVVFVSV